MKGFFDEIGKILLQILLIVPCIIFSIIKAFFACFALSATRFTMFFTYLYPDKKYRILKTINMIVCFVPFVAITIAEFAILFCIVIVAKSINTVLSIFPLIAIIPSFVFGTLTFVVVKFFEILQYILILPDAIHLDFGDFARINTLTENYENI